MRTLSPTRRPARGGRGILLAGVELSVLVVSSAIEVLEVIGDTDEEVASRDTEIAIDVHEMDVQVGACLESVEYVYDNIFRQVPCGAPHVAQVVAEREITDTEYEGRSTYITQAEDFCLPTSYQLVPDSVDPEPLVTRTISPTVGSWENGDRMIRCVLTVEGEHHLNGNFVTETGQVHDRGRKSDGTGR